MGSQASLLVITELFMPTKGGTAVWFDQVYPRIGGKDVHILTAEVEGANAYDQGHRNSIHRIQLGRRRWLRPESLFIYLKLLFWSLWLTAKHSPGQVHAGRVLPEGFIGLLVSCLFRIPLVVYAHGEEITTWRTPKKFRLMCYVYRRADRIIANSDFTKQQLMELGVNEDRITLIHPGVNLDRFTPNLPFEDLLEKLQMAPDEKLLLSVGRLSRRKGFDKVIQSLPALEESGIKVRYAVIGIGDDEQYLRDLSHSLGQDKRVHLLGHVPMEELPRWYNACDLFVMPNRTVDGDIEGFGMVFIEAAACGRTAVSGTSGGAVSAVKHQVTGLNCDGDLQQSVTDSIATLLKQDDLRQRLAAAAQQRARDDFGWDAVATNTIAILNQISASTTRLESD